MLPDMISSCTIFAFVRMVVPLMFAVDVVGVVTRVVSVGIVGVGIVGDVV